MAEAAAGKPFLCVKASSIRICLHGGKESRPKIRPTELQDETTDWKAVGIHVNDPLSRKLETSQEVELEDSQGEAGQIRPVALSG
ncbi:hypothetical protein M440DRAFT_1402663 [Trichoderma longibrachiatum ATCC 18648]|uniref:Uncharacterized protein n=1 Tax=Trichoderma longibrachiatum ATCC 18648 TaxID=983965 RepID=A0A2T4C0K3_TRILO|nr:hypothetical protein M440DRAFT_1402663 [Trichoderma longibrachiatum ATCC 18648]